MVAVALAAVAYPFRSDPIGPISGKALTGTPVPFPTDSSVCNDDQTVALESNPRDPHSVTALCFRYEGSPMILALRGAQKDWTTHVVQDSRVRIKAGNQVFPASAVRVPEVSIQTVQQTISSQYPSFAGRMTDAALAGAWFFRLEPRS